MATLLLDENVPRSAGTLLTDAGHDVRFFADEAPSADDRQVLAFARAQQRVLVTFDADFGDLIYQQHEAPPPAVVYLRLHPMDGAAAGALAAAALSEAVNGYFVVCTRETRRRRPLPVVVGDGRT